MQVAALPLKEQITPDVTRASRERILELDGMRGMAIVMVIVFHYVAIVQGPAYRIVPHVQRLLEIGWSGVDLFFVLSGFLIGSILLDAKRSKSYFKTFYGRRIYRIFPIYYLWIAAYFLLALVVSPHVADRLGIVHDKWTAALALILFLQNTVKTTPALASTWFFAMWSLAVEEQFYLVIPWLIRFLSSRRLIFALVSLIFLAPLSRIVFKLYFPGDYWAPHLLAFCRSDELAMGVLLAVFWRDLQWKTRIIRYKNVLYGALGLLSLGMVYIDVVKLNDFALCAWGYTCVGLFFTTLVLLTLAAPGGIWAALCRSSVLRNIGGVSYCMYIVHAVVNRVCHVLLSAPEGIATRRSLLATVVAAGMTWIVATVSWRLLESPLVRRAQAFRY